MAVAVQSGIDKIADYLGDDAADLLDYEALVNQNLLTLPGPDFIDRVFADSDRTIPVLNNLQRLLQFGAALGHRVHFHSPHRPGHRTLRRRRPLLPTPSTLIPKT